jgi:hypothetical protein
LIFADNGLVLSEKLRGRTTIDVLGLNRMYLVQARRRAAQRLLLQIKNFTETLQEGRDEQAITRDVEWFAACVRPEQEYAALHRQILRTRDVDSLFKQAKRPALQPKRAKPGPSEAQQQKIQEKYEAFLASQDTYSLDVDADRKKYFSRSRLIERIEIRNLKAIRELKLDLQHPESGTPWTMFLGENGTGKSTVLQAITLALCGAKYFWSLISELGVDADGFIRYGCKSGQVKVFLGPKPNVLTFEQGRVVFTNVKGQSTTVRTRGRKPSKTAIRRWGIQLLLLSYGATRLLPRTPELRRQRVQFSKFGKAENLFDPFVPMLDARTWLLNLPDDRFDYTALALKTLLDLDDRDTFVREDDNVFLRTHRARVPLERLSDGYHSVIALTADILEVVLGMWASPDMAEGVVLVDEIGSHMHPTWKMRIVSALREFLPRMQFIATTHDPLCLRGLTNREVVVMRRDTKGRAVAVRDLPSAEGLRVDQLLTSEYFGLNSTVDPAYQKLFDEYYELRRRPRSTKKQKARIKELRRSLDELGMMGRTRRERLMLAAIDTHLAREPQDLSETGREAGEERLGRTLAGILNELDEI